MSYRGNPTYKEIDGKIHKFCPRCEKYKESTPDYFYFRKSGQPYAYCYPCDLERISEMYYRNKETRQKMEANREKDRAEYLSETFKLLQDARLFLINRGMEGSYICSAIKGHLDLGQRIKILTA